jgi:hypothetical protein
MKILYDGIHSLHIDNTYDYVPGTKIASITPLYAPIRVFVIFDYSWGEFHYHCHLNGIDSERMQFNIEESWYLSSIPEIAIFSPLLRAGEIHIKGIRL